MSAAAETEMAPTTPRSLRRQRRRRKSELGVSALSSLFNNQATAPKLACQTYTDAAVRRFQAGVLLAILVGFVFIYVGATATPKSRTRTMAGSCGNGECTYAYARDARFASGGSYSIDHDGKVREVRTGHGHGCLAADAASSGRCRLACERRGGKMFAVPSWPGAAAARRAPRSFRSTWASNATAAAGTVRISYAEYGMSTQRRRTLSTCRVVVLAAYAAGALAWAWAWQVRGREFRRPERAWLFVFAVATLACGRPASAAAGAYRESSSPSETLGDVAVAEDHVLPVAWVLALSALSMALSSTRRRAERDAANPGAAALSAPTAAAAAEALLAAAVAAAGLGVAVLRRAAEVRGPRCAQEALDVWHWLLGHAEWRTPSAPAWNPTNGFGVPQEFFKNLVPPSNRTLFPRFLWTGRSSASP